MTNNNSWFANNKSWLPLAATIAACAAIFLVYLSFFNNQNTVVARLNKTDAEKAADTEGGNYVIDRDTAFENGQCRFKILQVIVKQSTVLVYFSLENRFKGNISTIEPYLVDLDNAGKITMYTNKQQFLNTNVEPSQVAAMVGEFEYSVGASKRLKLGFRYSAQGLFGDAYLPFELKK